MTSQPGIVRRLFWPTVSAVIAFVILVSLGTWQVHRLAWKEDLIAQIAARATAPPVSLDTAIKRWHDGENIEYLRVAMTGRWLNDREQFVWAVGPQGGGWDVFTPLLTASGQYVIVNRGFVPEAYRDRTRRPEPGGPNAEVHVVGLVRHPETPGLFTPDNDTMRNRWFWRDLDGMKKTMQLGDHPVAPMFIDAERLPPAVAAANPGLPRGGATHLTLPNSHLQYAVTWYGLALTLIGVYVAFVLSRLRQSGKPDDPDRK
ncbi:MAG: SURF1 family protein [Hyphomicrobiaceae bacterium]